MQCYGRAVFAYFLMAVLPANLADRRERLQGGPCCGITPYVYEDALAKKHRRHETTYCTCKEFSYKDDTCTYSVGNSALQSTAVLTKRYKNTLQSILLLNSMF